jgi:hypothetical protein
MESIKIPVGKNNYALVDPDDFEKVSTHSWWLHSKGYASTTLRSNGTPKNVKMHVMIAGPNKDHKNRNRLDNRKENLRTASRTQNSQNRFRENKNGYKGVRISSAKTRSYRARIIINKREICLGSFPTAREAAQAYDEAAILGFGEFACLNLPDERSSEMTMRIAQLFSGLNI